MKFAPLSFLNGVMRPTLKIGIDDSMMNMVISRVHSVNTRIGCTRSIWKTSRSQLKIVDTL
jgi:hypothetical protein